MIKTSEIIEAVNARVTATLRDWNPENCEHSSSGYIPAREGDTIDLHSESSVSAYTMEDGSIMIGTNGGDSELDASATYGVAEIAALAELRNTLDSALFSAYYHTKDEKNDPVIKRLDRQIDEIDNAIENRAIEALAAHEGLEIVSSSELPNAELLDSDPTVKTYADFGVKDQDGTVIVAFYSTNLNAGEYCTWGETRELDDGTTALDGYEPRMDEIEDFLAVALL